MLIVTVARLARQCTDGVLFNCAAPWPDGRINKALQCISVTKLAVFHNKVLRSSYQLETIKGAIHHRRRGAALAEVLTGFQNTALFSGPVVRGIKHQRVDLLHRLEFDPKA